MECPIIFSTWWQALAATPSSREEVDWWAAAGDQRATRYDRLLRVWGDHTDGCPAPFYMLKKEKHLVPTLWENFAIFHPRFTVEELYGVLGFPYEMPPLDLCWSYEFNLGHQDRQLDLVLHIRFSDHDEILIGEAKSGSNAFAPKDFAADEVLQRKQFSFAEKRRYFLIGDAPAPASWPTSEHGHVTWAEVYEAQLRLCSTLPESENTRQHVRRLIATQFAVHGILPNNTLKFLAGEIENLPLQYPCNTMQPDQFIRTATQHLRAVLGLSVTAPFGFLQDEPLAETVRKGWHPQCGKRIFNERQFWKLPERATKW